MVLASPRMRASSVGSRAAVQGGRLGRPRAVLPTPSPTRMLVPRWPRGTERGHACSDRTPQVATCPLYVERSPPHAAVAGSHCLVLSPEGSAPLPFA